MILCKDCLHCRPRQWSVLGEAGLYEGEDYDVARCRLTDVVTGLGDAGRLCIDERSNGLCGPDAVRFTPCPPPVPQPERARRWWHR